MRNDKNTAQPVPKEEKAAEILFSEKVLDFCLAYKWDIIVFAVGIIAAMAVILPGGILPWSPGHDASFYHKAAVRLVDIWKILPGFLYKFFANTYTLQDYAQMGFVDPSGIDTIFRAPIYSVYLSFWILLFGNSLPVLIASQLLIVGLIYAQLFRVLGYYISRRASLWMTFLSMLYFPLYCCAVMTLAELFTSLFLLLTLRLYIIASKAPSCKNLFWLGFLAVIATISKSSMMYFIVVFVVVITAMLTMRFRQKLKVLYGFFLLGVFVPMMIMFVVYSRTNGKYGFMESGAGGRNLYAGQQYRTNCIYTSGVYQEKWFVKEARKITNNVDPRRWFVQYSEVSSRAFVQLVKNDFGSFILHTVRKAGILTFFPPFNAYRYIASHDFLQNNYPIIVHCLLVLLAFSSVVFVRKTFDAKIFLCGVFLYHIAIYGMSNLDTRYFLPLAPLYMVFAGVLLGSFKTWNLKRKPAVQLAVLVLAIVVLYAWKLPAFMADYYHVYVVKVLLLTLLALGFVWIALKIVIKGGKWPDVVVAGLLLTFCFCCFESVLLTDKTFLSTSVKAKQEVAQEIKMDGMFRLSDYEKFYLMFDPSVKTDVAGLKISFNGQKLTSPVVSKVSPVSFAQVSKKAWVANEPKWNFVEVPVGIIKQNNTINIKSDGVFNVNADYPSKKVGYLPSHVYCLTSTQMVFGGKKIKHMEKRPFLKKKILSVSRASQVDGEQCEKVLRVYLLGKRKGGWCIPKQYEGLNRSHEFYLTLLRLTDRGIARYKTELTTEDVPVERPVIQALLGEFETFYSGYDLF